MANIVTKVGIEENGKVIVPPGEFEEIVPIMFDDGHVSDKLFRIKDGDEYDLLLISGDYHGGYIRYGSIHRLASINKNCIVISDSDERHGEKWAIIRTDTLDNITNFAYDLITPINENMYMTKKDGLYGVVDKNGNVILSNNFTEIAFESAHNAFTVKLYNSED